MKKSTWVAVLVCLSLGVAYWLTSDSEVSVGIDELLLPKFEQKTVDGIEVLGEKPVSLKRSGDEWEVQIAGGEWAPADKDIVDRMFIALLELKPGRLISERADKQKRFGVLDGAKGIKLKEGKDVLFELLIGKSIKHGDKVIRLAGSDEMFAAKGNFWAILKSDSKDWRKRSFAQIKKDSIEKLEISQGGNTLSFEKDRDDTDWKPSAKGQKLPDDFRLDQDKVEGVITAISNLRASDFVDSSDAKKTAEANLDKTQTTVKVFDKDKEALEIRLGKDSAGKEYYAMPKEGEQIYEISEYTFNNLALGAEKFRDLSLMDFEASQIANMKIQTAKRETLVEKKAGSWSISKPSKLPEGFEADWSRVDAMLRSLKNLKASRVATSQNKSVVSSKNIVVSVELKDKEGKTSRVRFGAPVKKGDENGPVYVIGSIDDKIYEMPSIFARDLEKGVELFRKEEPSPSPASLNSLPPDIRKKLEQAMRNRGSGQ